MLKETTNILSMENCWLLLENGRVIDEYPSKTKAKNAKWWKEKEARENWLDLSYEIKPKTK